MSTATDYAQAGELKFGQVGIANLRVRTLDVAQLVTEMRERVQRAPNLFTRAAGTLAGSIKRRRKPAHKHWWMACAVLACCRWPWRMAPKKSKHYRNNWGCHCWPNSVPNMSAQTLRHPPSSRRNPHRRTPPNRPNPRLQLPPQRHPPA